MKYHYFISDIHLTTKDTNLLKSFHSFLDNILADSASLYILGDLFNYWISEEEIPAEFIDIFEHLKKCVDQNVPVYFIVGNRDFLISNTFLKRFGIILLADPSIITIQNNMTRTICLTHGDSLCTNDVSYQVFKSILRSRIVRKGIQALNHKQKLYLATFLRFLSTVSYKIKKGLTNYDVSESAILKLHRNYKFDLLIHGHIHKPGVHLLTIDDTSVTRIVLGDWGNCFNVVKMSVSFVDRLTW
ncbi:MAG: UDP-2,3-diacylglucosamine diphosphatase [Methylacidiphilales bacterium]|nr:UDP-2,3-diacylglucosamine diphosphatase [Candidatus Methylacidiphilales bacterium]